MSERAVVPMSEAEFLAFTLDREGRWELVYGVPCAMAGAGRSHVRITMNALRMLGTQLRGKPCEPFSGDTFIRIPRGNYRIADAGVDCGQAVNDDRWAVDPRLVIEVLSPSNRYTDVFEKLEEYKTIAGLQHILVVEPDRAHVAVWSRGELGWTRSIVKGLEARVELPALGLVLPLAELYERVELSAAPEGLYLVDVNPLPAPP